MKKFICAFISMLMLFAMSFSASAGSIPLDLAEYDEAVIYFGQVKKVYYSSEQALIKPVKVIKGDVPADGTLVLENTGLTPLIPGNTYIFSVFRDTGETYIFYPDSYDTETLKLAERGSFWEEVQKRINSGRYKETDNMRIDRNNEALIKTEGIMLSEACEISKDLPQTVVAGKNTEVSHEGFYTLCEEITAYPIDISNNINTSLITASISLTNGNTLDITSDGKIQICSPKTRSIYVVSTEDKDRLLSLLPEKDLPFINQGTILLCTSVLLTAVVIAAVILTVKKKKNKAK